MQARATADSSRLTLNFLKPSKTIEMLPNTSQKLPGDVLKLPGDVQDLAGDVLELPGDVQDLPGRCFTTRPKGGGLSCQPRATADLSRRHFNLLKRLETF